MRKSRYPINMYNFLPTMILEKNIMDDFNFANFAKLSPYFIHLK